MTWWIGSSAAQCDGTGRGWAPDRKQPSRSGSWPPGADGLVDGETRQVPVGVSCMPVIMMTQSFTHLPTID